MLPGPTNVPERVTRAMVTPSINHRSDDFVELYEECVNNTKTIFETEGDAVCLSASGTGAVECSVVNLIKKDDTVVGILTGRQKDAMIPVDYHSNSKNTFAKPPKN